MTLFPIVKRQIVPPGLAIYMRLWASLVLRCWGPCKSIKDNHDNVVIYHINDKRPCCNHTSRKYDLPLK